MFSLKEIDQALYKKAIQGISFEFYRLIDPQNWDVYDYKNGTLIRSNNKCYAFWKNNYPCENCSSRIAANENKEIFKLKMLNDTIFMVLSIPIEINAKLFVIELIKDVSTSLFAYNEFSCNQENIFKLIDGLNVTTVKDSFTSLYTKTFTINQLDAEIAKPENEKKKIFAAFIDIDYFKEVNDLYGHITGDEVLIKISKLIIEEFETIKGWATRMGGDEFLLIYYNKSEEEVNLRCQNLYRKITQFPFKKDDREFYIDISIGITSLKCSDNVLDFLGRADKNMYSQKREHHKKREKQFKTTRKTDGLD